MSDLLLYQHPQFEVKRPEEKWKQHHRSFHQMYSSELRQEFMSQSLFKVQRLECCDVRK